MFVIVPQLTGSFFVAIIKSNKRALETIICIETIVTVYDLMSFRVLEYLKLVVFLTRACLGVLTCLIIHRVQTITSSDIFNLHGKLKINFFHKRITFLNELICIPIQRDKSVLVQVLPGRYYPNTIRTICTRVFFSIRCDLEYCQRRLRLGRETFCRKISCTRRSTRRSHDACFARALVVDHPETSTMAENETRGQRANTALRGAFHHTSKSKNPILITVILII